MKWIYLLPFTLQKEGQVEEDKKRKRNRLNNHGKIIQVKLNGFLICLGYSPKYVAYADKRKGSQSQPDKGFSDYEEVNHHSGRRLRRNLRKVTPVGVELKAATEDATPGSEQKIEVSHNELHNPNPGSSGTEDDK